LASRVLDASAFYAGIPFGSPEKNYTTSLIFQEIKHIKKNYEAVSVLLNTRRLVITDPEPEYVNIVSSKAEETGDFQEISKEDISAIALSLQLKADLITDDFAVSNVSKHLGIAVMPVMTKGISRIINWDYFCPGCKKTYSKISECPLCGNKLKRKLRDWESSSNPVIK